MDTLFTGSRGSSWADQFPILSCQIRQCFLILFVPSSLCCTVRLAQNEILCPHPPHITFIQRACTKSIVLISLNLSQQLCPYSHTSCDYAFKNKSRSPTQTSAHATTHPTYIAAQQSTSIPALYPIAANLCSTFKALHHDRLNPQQQQQQRCRPQHNPALPPPPLLRRLRGQPHRLALPSPRSASGIPPPRRQSVGFSSLHRAGSRSVDRRGLCT